MMINIEELKQDLKEDDYGAFFIGGFGGAFVETINIDKASPDQVIKVAIERGFDLKKYECYEEC